MRMGIDEAGHDDVPSGIDGLGAVEPLRDGVGRVDRDDVATVNRDRPRSQHPPAPVHRHHCPAGDDERDVAAARRRLTGQNRRRRR